MKDSMDDYLIGFDQRYARYFDNSWRATCVGIFGNLLVFISISFFMYEWMIGF